MDLENNQDFDLEDILKEFGEHPETEEHTAGQMPELRFDEETAQAPEELPAQPEEQPEPQETAPAEPLLSDTQNLEIPQEPEMPEASA